jgi:hypothetical protein
MRPTEFRETYMVTQKSPYEVKTECPGHGGVLNIGRVVWIKQRLAARTALDSVSAYAEGIGMVWLDPRNLVPTDGTAFLVPQD